MIFFSKYLRHHITILDFIYRKCAVASNATIFCFMFNLRARLKRRDVRFYFNKKENIYIAKSKNYKRYFFEKYQNYNCYIAGIEKRGISLGEAYFLLKIKFRDNDTVIDCGANTGDLKIYFDEKKLKINYIGIEPSPKEYFCLSKNITPSKAINIGLWNVTSNLTLYVSSFNADSSFFEPKAYSHKVTIPAKRLDSFNFQHIRLLKIEAEGAEIEALIGSENLLARIDYISADLGFERGVLEESTLVPVTNFLLKHNFELIDFSSPRICALYKRIGVSLN
ncbi:MAG: FkbM family methyltransferase [Polynucleobacter sp.]|nr:FkbM family methyltransferase [Polynucleobacter sp.]